MCWCTTWRAIVRWVKCTIFTGLFHCLLLLSGLCFCCIQKIGVTLSLSSFSSPYLHFSFQLVLISHFYIRNYISEKHEHLVPGRLNRRTASILYIAVHLLSYSIMIQHLKYWKVAQFALIHAQHNILLNDYPSPTVTLTGKGGCAHALD